MFMAMELHGWYIIVIHIRIKSRNYKGPQFVLAFPYSYHIWLYMGVNLFALYMRMHTYAYIYYQNVEKNLMDYQTIVKIDVYFAIID